MRWLRRAAQSLAPIPMPTPDDKLCWLCGAVVRPGKAGYDASVKFYEIQEHPEDHEAMQFNCKEVLCKNCARQLEEER